jgi:triacylglycerol lipase
VATSVGLSGISFLDGPDAAPTYTVSINPSTENFLYRSYPKPLTIRNTGTSAWTIANWSTPFGFSVNDPLACRSKTYAPNDTCSVSLIPDRYQSDGNFTVTTNRGTSGNSYLNGPDSPTRDPILFVHGLNGSAATWATFTNYFVNEPPTWWAASGGWNGLNLYSYTYNDAETNATTAVYIKTLVDSLQATSPTGKVDIICHSMGCLAGRHYLKNLGGTTKVDAFVSLAGVNHGTTSIGTYSNGVFTAGLPPVPETCYVTASTARCKEMAVGSPFVTALNSGDETPGPVRYATWRSECDPVVNPDNSVVLNGADNRAVNFPLGDCWDSHSLTHEWPSIYAQVRDFVKHPSLD